VIPREGVERLEAEATLRRNLILFVIPREGVESLYFAIKIARSCRHLEVIPREGVERAVMSLRKWASRDGVIPREGVERLMKASRA